MSTKKAPTQKPRETPRPLRSAGHEDAARTSPMGVDPKDHQKRLREYRDRRAKKTQAAETKAEKEA